MGWLGCLHSEIVKRKSYQNTWSEIGDEYDKDFAQYMDKLAKGPNH
jgi:hypothetical protein